MREEEKKIEILFKYRQISAKTVFFSLFCFHWTFLSTSMEQQKKNAQLYIEAAAQSGRRINERHTKKER